MTEPSPLHKHKGSRVRRIVTIVAAAVAVGWAVPLVWFGYASRNVRFVIDPNELAIRGSMYGRSIPRGELLASQAAVVSFDLHTSRMSPARRINGVEFPGYKEGWYRLADGRKALIFVTERGEVVLVPTVHDYVLLLSPVKPEIFAASLRADSAVTQTFAIVPAMAGPLIFVELSVLALLAGWLFVRWLLRRLLPDPPA